MISDLFLLIINYILKFIALFLPEIAISPDFTIPVWIQDSLGFVSGFFPLALLFKLITYVLFIEIAFVSYRLVVYFVKFTPFVKTDHMSKS